MRLFNKYIAGIASFIMISSGLVACSGGGVCNPSSNPSGALSLSIDAPSQYPAGLPVAIEAQLTMTNTSTVNANNLVYTIPAPNNVGNYTGVVITPNAGVGSTSGDCTNIAAGASCTFTAIIGAFANPGSFTVTATPDATLSTASMVGNNIIQANSITVTANLALVDVPANQHKYYILPSNQTVIGSDTTSTTVYVSVWLQTAATNLRLIDETGANLVYEAVGTPTTLINGVNTYQVIIPPGKSVQRISAVSDSCLFGDTPACSNEAIVNLAPVGAGILSIQPNYFNMSESYNTQVVTLINTGAGNVSNIVHPTLSSQFSIVSGSDLCSGITTLIPNQRCTFTIMYTPNATSGVEEYTLNYNNSVSQSPSSVTAQIPYVGISNVTTTTNPELIDGSVGNIVQESSFTIILNSNSVAPQTITASTSANGVSFTNNGCQVSTSIPCTITVNIESNATVQDNQSVLLTNSTTSSMEPNPSSVGFNVTEPIKKVIYYAHNGLNGYNGNLGGTVGADDKCNADIDKPSTPVGATYKAVLVDGTDPEIARVACTTANCTTPSGSWVLYPNTLYVNASGAKLGTTNGAGIFTSALDNAIAPIPVITGGFNIAWTGLATSGWTTANSPETYCGGWTVEAINPQGTFGVTSETDYLYAFFGMGATSCNNAIANGIGMVGIYCAEE